MKKEFEKIKRDTDSIVVALQHATETEGYISPTIIDEIALAFGVSRTEVYSVASFYNQFSFKAKGQNRISICMGTACFVCGGEEILRAVEKHLNIKEGGITPDGMFSIERNVRCLGRCAEAPIVQINDKFYPKAGKQQIVDIIKNIQKAAPNKSGVEQ